ncbi:MAG: hypothetical protein ACRDOI_02120 [Trebonia sp.]
MTQAPRALEAPRASGELAGSVRWLRANPVLAAGLLLIGAQLWWKAGLFGPSFFRLDDYYYIQHASAQGLTWSYLTWVDTGHLDVTGSAIAWVLVRVSAYDWTLASAATLVLLGCTCFALLRMLRVLFGDRPGILLLLALYLLSPLSLPGLSWWTVSLAQLPLQLGIFCAVSAHVRYLRTRRFSHAVAAAAWQAVAMLSAFQGAAVPLLLFAVTSAFFSGGAWSRALWPALREHWRAWGLYIALAAAYVALYLARLSTSAVGLTKPASFADVLTYAGTLLRETFVPGAFGGPWRWSGAGVEALTAPPPALAWMSWVLAIVIVLISLMYTWRAWRAWAILAGWLIVVDIVPVLAGRSSLVSGAVLGLSARYVWDATGLLALCLGLAFMPLADAPGAGRSPRRLSRPEFAAATTVIVAIIFGSLWSFYDYPADPAAGAARGYIATARLALAGAPRGTVIVDDPVPSDVTGGFTGPVADASSVLSPLLAGSPGDRPRFTARPDGTYDHLLEFDGYGRLVPSSILGVASRPRPATGACWPAKDDSVVVRLNSVAAGASTLRIGYLSRGPGQVLVTFGVRSLLYNVQPGVHAAYLPVAGGSAATVIIAQVSGTLPCVGDVQAGVLLPSAAGAAVPPLPVTG